MKLFSLVLIIAASSIFHLHGQEKSWNGPAVDFKHGRLRISKNKRFLVFDDGTPFFYLGETAWEIFHRLNKEEVELFLENRRSKGFTVIQSVALAELDGLNVPNAYGEKPLIDNDPLKPNEKYFAYVDWVIKKAQEKGLFIGLLPTWGDKVDQASWGTGPVIFNADNAYKYGKWIANRYKDYLNIIWINGGDRLCGGANQPVFDALGRGLRDADPNHLITLHPGGEHSSSEWFHNSAWLDFNMTQTGHCQRSYATYEILIKTDYNKIPVKPCFDGEPRYEDHPVCWDPSVLGWFNDADVRQAAYWSLFTGSFGHTYGCHAIWQFLSEGREAVGYARNDWKKDMDLPGAFDMIHVRRLIESRPMLSRIPDQTIITIGYIPDNNYIIATRGDGYAFIYSPTGWEINVNLDKLALKKVTAYWYDPRNGQSMLIGSYEGKGTKAFRPASSGRGNDWVLVLDDEARRFAAPGQASNSK